VIACHEEPTRDVEAKTGLRSVMHVVYVRVGIKAERTEESLKSLQGDIVPRIKETPGFVRGTWYGDDTTGHAVMVFETEERAEQLAATVTAESDDPIEIEGVQVYELHADA
jgi:quinol monooxygenase YgiN